MALPLSRLHVLPIAAAAFALALPTAAQCDLSWLPGVSASGPDGQVLALLPLPNGDVIAGGTFQLADAASALNVARWDGTTWQAMGNGLSSTVRALARLPNGDIVAGGLFTASGSTPLQRIALWNGTSWVALGTGMNGVVNALVVEPNGDVVAGGAFHNAGGVAANLVARWNGVAWSAFGSGPATGFEVRAIVRRANGDIVVGGDLFSGSNSYGWKRWDGSTWQNVPGLDPGFQTVAQLAQRPNGDIVAQGSFTLNSQGLTMVRWDGTTMHPLVPPIAPNGSLFAASNGDVYAGTNNLAFPDLQRWDGAVWTTVPGGPPRQTAIAEDATGRLLLASNQTLLPRERTVVRYDGVSWQTLGAPTPPLVNAFARLPNGDVVIGGKFSSFGGVAANNLARWNGTAWSAFGAGVDGIVRALAVAPDGDLVVGGGFANAGGAPANRVARWNGQAWSTLGGGLTSDPVVLAAGANGEVFAAFALASNNLRRFDGIVWSTPLTSNPLQITYSVAALPDGSYAIGGLFFAPGTSTVTGLLRYDAGTITTFPGWPAGSNPINRLHVDRQGRLLAAGNGLLRRLDGATWTTLPAISLQGLSDLPNGELIAGGQTATVGAATSSLRRLRAGVWEPFGDVLPNIATAITASDRGEVFAAGNFHTAAGQVSYGFAHGQPTCPATTAVVGAGCTGGAGPVVLSSSGSAWVGGVFVATATGMTANSLALQIVGTPAPATALPGGAPGCSLFLAPLLAEGLVPSGGVATTAWLVPNTPALVGVQARLQVVGVELSGASIVRLTSTNALQLTIGAL